MKFIMTSPFGALEALREGTPHTGIDLGLPMKTPLRSFCDAVVEKVTDYGHANIGKGVILKLKDGTRYIWGHMDSVNSNLHPGDKIHAGTLLGFSGNSGNSTGPHLHFGEWKNGQYTDPSDVIEKVDAYAGSVNHNGVITELVINKVREHAKEYATDTILGTLDAIRSFALDAEYSIFLIATGVLVILRAVGFKHPWIRPGVMMALHVIIRLLLGGFAV